MLFHQVMERTPSYGKRRGALILAVNGRTERLCLTTAVAKSLGGRSRSPVYLRQAIGTLAGGKQGLVSNITIET